MADSTPAPESATPPKYACPGLDIPQPENYVACYRAGHACPPKVAIRRRDEDGRHVTWRCPCCGDFGGAMFLPSEWID